MTTEDQKVDRSNRTLADGSPVTADALEINPSTGQQRAYVVLSEEERAKGFVRPVRRTYIHIGKDVCGLLEDGGFGKAAHPRRFCGRSKNHIGDCGNWSTRTLGCGSETRMGQAIAETYARDPKFYTGTFCAHCGSHFPLDQFVWKGTREQVGT